MIGAYSEVPFWNFPARHAGAIREEFKRQLRVIHVTHDRALARVIGQAHWLCTTRIRPEFFLAAGKLEWIHSPSSGVGSILIPEVVQSSVLVTNSRGENSVTVAEQVLAYLLAFTRRLHDAVLYQRQKIWAGDIIWATRPPLDEAQGKTIGIVGFGCIGREIGRRAAAFGMRVLAIKRRPRVRTDCADLLLPPDQLPRLLKESDFVVLSLPSTAQTTRVIGAGELVLMRRSAFLINVSRGQAVDEEALVDAVREGRIAGAALDVFAAEPLPPQSLLWKLPNVIITPHYAGSSVHTWDRLAALLRKNIRRMLAGKPPLNRVNKKLGY